MHLCDLAQVNCEAEQVELAHLAGDSSVPSKQSLSLSHTQKLLIHFDPSHRKKFSRHSFVSKIFQIKPIISFLKSHTLCYYPKLVQHLFNLNSFIESITYPTFVSSIFSRQLSIYMYSACTHGWGFKVSGSE